MTDSHIINHTACLTDAIGQLNSLSGGIMTLMVVDDTGVMVGTLTDGDVRRALLAGHLLDGRVSDVMHRQFKSLRYDDINVAKIREYRKAGIKLLPILGADGTIQRLLNLSNGRSSLPVRAVLMAGGRGERMRPMTDTVPKPLLPIAGKAIIDYNIEALAKVGINDITVSTRYLAHKIEEHFSAPVAGVSVKCIKENIPLGTIGAMSLLDNTADDGTTLIMNSDLLTTISFEDMYLAHIDNNADITIAVLPYVVSVPYAVLQIDTDGKQVKGIEEKPTYSYYANAGIYLVRNRLLNALVKGEHLDATEFIEINIKRGMNVSYYPITGTWIDVGTPADFRQAEDLMRHLQNFSYT